MMFARAVKVLVSSLAIFFVVASSSPGADAHTSAIVTAKCPVCGEQFPVRVTLSLTSFGSYLDFQQKGAIGSYYEDLIYSCPICHFSGYEKDFSSKIPEDIRKRVLAELKPALRSQKLDDVEECEVTAKIYVWQRRKNEEIAQVYLLASYLLRGTGGKSSQQRKELQALASGYFVKALEAKEIASKNRGVASYLIGDLYRRIGEFKKALSWYGRALNEKENPDWLKDIVKKQQGLAKKKDPNNEI